VTIVNVRMHTFIIIVHHAANKIGNPRSYAFRFKNQFVQVAAHVPHVWIAFDYYFVIKSDIGYKCTVFNDDNNIQNQRDKKKYNPVLMSSSSVVEVYSYIIRPPGRVRSHNMSAAVKLLKHRRVVVTKLFLCFFHNIIICWYCIT